METQTAGSGVSGFFGRLGDILGPDGPRTLILLIGLLLLLLALFSISRQIARGRVRHRREYAAHVVQALREDPQCRMALAMLEGHDRRLPLLGPAAPASPLDDRRIGAALIPPEIRADRDDVYDAEELAIRDSFTALLGRLDDLEIMVRAGLVRFAEIRPYLERRVRLLATPNWRSRDESPRALLLRNLWLHAEASDLPGARDFVARFGRKYRIKVDKKDLRKLETEWQEDRVWRAGPPVPPPPGGNLRPVIPAGNPLDGEPPRRPPTF